MAQPKPVPKVKQRKPLKRKRYMRKRRARRIERQTPMEQAFVHWLHDQPCALRSWECNGSIQAAHFRDMTGLGRKERDETCIPLCRKHHEDYDQAKNYFAAWDRGWRKLWHQARQSETRAIWAALSEGAREFWSGLAEVARRRMAKGEP